MAQKNLPNILERGEAVKLLNQFSEDCLTGLRNKAIVSLMLNTGLRLSEASGLRPKHLNLKAREIRVVKGKGGKDRFCFVPDALFDLLKKWQQRRPRGKYFFNTLKGKRLNNRYIQAMVKRGAKTAKIKKRVYPHLLRHTYATNHYQQKKNIEALRELLGHASISTTQIYITLSKTKIKEQGLTFTGFE